MFIVSLQYIKPIEEIEKYLEAHKLYLDKYYKKEIFVMSGRKVPRTGGIILINAKNIDVLRDIINEDPFKQNNIAEYSITEFLPSKVSNGLEMLLI